MELLAIETYNDGINFVNTVFRKLHVNFPVPGSSGKPEILAIYEDQHTGKAGNYSKPFTILTSNEIDKVPVFRVTADGLEPVMIEPTPDLTEGEEGYVPPYQKTIGGFDVWKELVFKNAYMPLNVALADVVKRQKGLTTQPMYYVE
jgi:hypothetical protein